MLRRSFRRPVHGADVLGGRCKGAGAVAAAFLAAEGALPEEAVQKVRFKALLDFCERLRVEAIKPLL